MKQTLQALIISAASLVALSSCKSEAADTTTETVTTTTTTTTYEGGAGSGGGADLGGSGSGSASDMSTAAADNANGRTVYVNEGRRNTEPRKKKVVVRSAYTPGNFPESSERILTEKDVAHLSPWGKKLMMNEIYARHGMTFSDPALKEHFAKQSWYDGKHKNVNSKLTAIERQNLELLND